MGYLKETKKVVEDTFEELEWKYNVTEGEQRYLFKTGLMLNENAKISKIVFYIAISENEVIITSLSDIKADKNNIDRVSEFLCRANWGMMNGNFEYNYDDGSIRYKVYIKMTQNAISKDDIISSITLSADLWTRYGNGLIDVLGSDESVKDIVTRIEMGNEE